MTRVLTKRNGGIVKGNIETTPRALAFPYFVIQEAMCHTWGLTVYLGGGNIKEVWDWVIS